MKGRIWLLADTHIGCRSNSILWLTIIEDYFYNFFIPLVKKEYQEGDILIHLGDVFDNRQSLNLAAQHLGITIFEDLGKLFDSVHVIVGNHDIMKKTTNNITSIDCLKYIPGVKIYKEPEIIEVGSSKCLLMPWRKDSNHETETLNQYKKNIDYLFCHTETQGVQTSPSKTRLHEGGNPISSFDKFGKVYSGHIHYRQEKENLIFVGNPYQMTRSDRDNQKGVYIIDTKSNSHKFVPNLHSPRFIRYYIKDILNVSLGDLTNQIIGNFIDIYIPSDFLGKYKITSFLESLEEYPHSLEPKIYDDLEDKSSSSIQEYQSTHTDFLEISKEYVNSLDYDTKTKESLIKSIEILYKQVQHENN